jgi:hypothetical protein
MRILDSVSRKIFESRVDWAAIDVSAAGEERELLGLLREACLVESWFPLYMAELSRLLFDDLEATAVFTIEAFEAYGHFYLLRRYLEHVGGDAPNDEEIVALRRRAAKEPLGDVVRELVNFMGTELFAADFFESIGERTGEAELRRMLVRFAKEEYVHSDFAKGLLHRMVADDPGVGSRVEEAALDFTHVGRYILPELSTGRSDNVALIQRFNRAVADVTGRLPSEAAVDPKRGGSDHS